MTGLARVPDRAWNDVLAETGATDLYLLREHLAASALLDGGEPVLVQLRGEGGAVVFAFLLRDVPGAPGLCDVITPYGYGGPVATGTAPPVAAFHAAWDAWCRDERVVSSFVRFHPLYGNHAYAHPRAEVVQTAGTVGVRLDRDRDLLMGMHGKHRNVVRKATAAGVEVVATPAPADLTTFTRLYEVTMQRQAAAEFYFFSPDYWAALRGELADRVVLFDGWHEGRIVASALCFATAPWLHYHLGATADEARNLGASNLLLHEAARWGQERGYERLHLGGGVGGGDDHLLRFKRRFDDDGLLPCAIGKVVHDEAQYQLLAGTDSTAGYFPAYRSPQPTSA